MNNKVITYVSSSEIPSSSANSIQVLSQCLELSKMGFKVNLYFSSNLNKNCLVKKIYEKYGFNTSSLVLHPSKTYFGLTNNFFIVKDFFVNLILKKNNGKIITRNFYVSFLLTILNIKHSFEVHHIEKNYFKKQIQLIAISGKFTKVIYISNALLCNINQKIKIRKSVNHEIVLPDASDIEVISELPEKYTYLNLLFNKLKNQGLFICGYFGTLNRGKGLHHIIEISKKDKNNCFVIAGTGIDKKLLEDGDFKNIIYIGQIPCTIARYIQKNCDVLLMPYQEVVKVGSKGQDTAKWMSPLKMFEYMSTKVPIISSDLDVIKEVLINQKNCLLCSPSNSKLWLTSIRRLKNNNKLAKKLADNAFNDLMSKYTWRERTRKLVAFLKNDNF